MTETMTLTVKLEADSLLRTARMLEAAADALDPGATDAALRQEALEAKAFARTVAQMTAAEVQRVLDSEVSIYGIPDGAAQRVVIDAELEADDAGQRAARAESEDNDDPAGYEGTGGDDEGTVGPVLGTESHLRAALLASGATEVTVEGLYDGEIEVLVSGGEDQAIARAIHAALPVGIVTRGNTLVGFTGADGKIHEVRFSRPVRVANPTSQAAAADVELDSAGYAWDEQIHSSARTKTKDGRWKYLRGVDKHLVEEVEFKQKNPPTVITAPTLQEAASAPVADPGTVPPPPATTPTPPPPPAAAPAPAGQLIEMQPDPASITTFRQLMPYIGKHKFTQAQLMEACLTAGAQSVPILMQRQDLIPAVVTALEAIRAAKP